MMSKTYADMIAPIPLGCEWSSVASYMFKHYSNEILMLMFEFGFHNNVEEFHAYILGMTMALGMLGDNGIPFDLDELLYGWDHDEPFDLEAAIRLAQENL